MTPAKAGIIALIVILVLTFEGFTRFNPFRSPFEMKATFNSVNNLQPKSPVRIHRPGRIVSALATSLRQ